MKRLGCLVVDGDEVDEESGGADHGRHQERADDHLSDPELSTQASVQGSAEEAVNGRSDGVHEDGGV